MLNKLKIIISTLIFICNTSLASSLFVMDLDSGKVLINKNGSDILNIPNFSKIMSIYITLEYLKRGEISLEDNISVEYFHKNKSVIKIYTVKQALPILMVSNDKKICIEIAKLISGSIPAFVKLMNQQSRILLMGSNFYHPYGDENNECFISAEDIAKLVRTIYIKHNSYFNMFKNNWILNEDVLIPNSNEILHLSNIDLYGIASSMESKSFSNVVVSNTKNMFLVAISLEDESLHKSQSEIVNALNEVISNFETFKIYSKGEHISSHRVWYGTKHSVKTGLAKNLYLTLPKNQYQHLDALIKYNPKSFAPINIGDVVGVLEVKDKNSVVINSYPIISLQSSPLTNIYFQGLDFVLYNLFQKKNMIEQYAFGS